jgi:tetratricopeptide (TPR) repeat protein
VVREAVGLAAYAVGDWTTAIAELRTYHRMTGRQTHLAELADCERALGRPERAIDLFRGADKDTLDKAGAIELLIVAAGARGDLGQHDAAVAMLQVRELTADEDAEWAVRLRYAYADALLAAGRRDEAREWFARTAAVDEDSLTDAAERLLELDGVTIEGDDPEEQDDEAAAGPTAAPVERGDGRVGVDDEAGSGGVGADGGPEAIPADEEDEEYTDEAFVEDEEDLDDRDLDDRGLDDRGLDDRDQDDRDLDERDQDDRDLDERDLDDRDLDDRNLDGEVGIGRDGVVEDVDAGIDAPEEEAAELAEAKAADRDAGAQSTHIEATDELADGRPVDDGATAGRDLTVDDIEGDLPAKGDKEPEA